MRPPHTVAILGMYFKSRFALLLVVVFLPVGVFFYSTINPQKYRQFLRATAVPAGTAEARTSYGNSVCSSVRPSVRLSVCLSRPGGIPSPGEIETPGLHHMVAWSIYSFL